jgi:hypothetical protein
VREIAFEGVTASRPVAAGGAARARGEEAVLGARAARTDRDFLEFEYRNLGYEEVVVDPRTVVFAPTTRGRRPVRRARGPQILVDYIIIVGNERTAPRRSSGSCCCEPGEPLGYSALIESRSRLIALGLFRRVQIEPLAHTGGRSATCSCRWRRPVYTLGFGGGSRAGSGCGPGPTARAQERLELAPRGFFEIGRRNLWGKNRSINLFTRVSLRSRDIGRRTAPSMSPGRRESVRIQRVPRPATYREPRVFGTRADVLVTGIFDQAIRTRFNFITREARAEVGLAALAALQHDRPLHRQEHGALRRALSRGGQAAHRPVFPQVRLSKFAGSMLRDTRDDLLDPSPAPS